MAAPLTFLLIVAVTIRAVLFRSSLAELISERVEVVSPLNAWKRVVEGLSLLDLGVSPYSGDVFHETPLIIYLFHFVVDYAELVFMIADGITAVALYLSIQIYNKNVFRKQKYALESDRYPADCLELLRSPKEMFYVPLKVAMFYLLNPFTILSCVAKSTCGLNNAIIALFILCTLKGSALLSGIMLALATYQSIYPLTLFAPALLFLLQRLYIPVNLRRSSFWSFTLQYAFIYVGSLVVITGLSFFLLGSWDFIPSVYGFMSVSSHTSHYSQILIQISTVCVCVFSTDFLFQTSLQTSDSSGTSSQRCLSTSVSFSSASSRSMSFFTPSRFPSNSRSIQYSSSSCRLPSSPSLSRTPPWEMSPSTWHFCQPGVTSTDF
ncbi:unnamed protein product [Leuciscus chuanchicus]